MAMKTILFDSNQAYTMIGDNKTEKNTKQENKV